MAEITNKTLAELEKNLDSLSPKEVNDALKEIFAMDKDQIEALDKDGKLSELFDRLDANPRTANYQRRQSIASGVEGGIDALKTISNLRVARRQIDEAQRLEQEIQDPQAPPTTPKSVELAAATETARRDLSQPIREIDPILQRNMDMLRSGFNVADTASGGQAGISAAGRQSAINQSRNAMNQMIPAIEGIRRQQQAEYNRLIGAGISEDDMRFKQSMSKYRVAENRYLMESQAVGALGAQGNTNLYGQQTDLYNQIGRAVNPLVNFNYGGNAQSAPSSTPSTGYNPLLNQQFIPQSAPQFTAASNLDPKFQDYQNEIAGNLDRQYQEFQRVPFNAGSIY